MGTKKPCTELTCRDVDAAGPSGQQICRGLMSVAMLLMAEQPREIDKSAVVADAAGTGGEANVAGTGEGCSCFNSQYRPELTALV